MKMPFKVALPAMLGVFSMALAASFMLTDMVSNDAKNVKQSFTMQLRRATRTLVEMQSDQLADRLAKLVEIEALTPDKITDLTSSEFIAVGLLSAAPGEIQGWLPDWVESKSSQIAAQWVKDLISKLPIERVKGNEVSWSLVSTSDGQVYFLLMVELLVKSETGTENKIAFGALPTSIFSAINLISKGEDGSVFVVDGQGNTFSYPDQQYVGGKITTHPIVASLIKTQSIELTGQFGKSRDNAIIGGYDKIDNTNLYVVASAPVNSEGAIFTKFIFQVAVVCLALMLIVSFGVIFIASREKQKIHILEKNLELMQTTTKVEPIVVRGGDDNLREFAKGVASFLRGPVSSIIGLVQIADSKNQDKGLKDSIDKITTEVRKVRNFAEALSKVVAAPEVHQEILELNPAVGQLVSNYRSELEQFKISIEENLKTTLVVRANHDELRRSLRAILLFMINTISVGVSQRKLLINAEKNGGMAVISFEGRGAELKPEVRRKLFSPFEIAVQNSEILGLDLALAQNYFNEINGEISVESIGSDGFRIIIRLPTATKVTAEPTKAEALALTPPSITVPKPVSAEGSAVFPPPPKMSEPPEGVTVVQKLTLDQTESKSDESTSALIRRPKLRIDT